VSASRLAIDGTVTAMPASPTAANGLTAVIGLAQSRNYGNFACQTFRFAADPSSPRSLAPGISKIRFVSLRSVNRDLLRGQFTSAAGVNRFDFDEGLLWESTVDGSEMTDVAVSGSGVIEYVIAGD